MRCISWLCLAACGGSSGSPDPAPDASLIVIDELATCPSSVAGTVFDSPSAFVPMMTTISAREVVKFDIGSGHFVIPNISTTTDDALRVGEGQTKCLQFNVPGTYGFACGVHGFAGTIAVQ
jgi:plastocyanin